MGGRLRNILLTVLVFIVASVSSISESLASPLRRPFEAKLDQRLEQVLGELTLEEKVQLLGGTGLATHPIPRLNIPELTMADGPMGLSAVFGKATAFPSGIAMGASFNPDLVRRAAQGMARDAKARGRYMLLGPCVNLLRTPFGGRNFESYGEDPVLASKLAAAFVEGVQAEGVVASVKHFALNEQEHDRYNIDARADERTLREIHFPAFEAAVKAGVWSVMASYNRFNGIYATENAWLLTDLLKREWGFQGFVVSDWGATHSTVAAALAGLDLEMPYGTNFNQALVDAVRAGQVPMDLIDDKIRRIWRPMQAIGLFDNQIPSPSGNTDDPANRALALELADESLVLLKNDGVLPIDLGQTQSIAVIGPNAAHYRHGGGSSLVDPNYTVTPLQGLSLRAGAQVRLVYAEGASMTPNPDPSLVPRRAPEEELATAVAAAQQADLVLLFVGLGKDIESEGFDRSSLELPQNQIDLIEAVLRVNSNVVLVINSGAPVLLHDWPTRARAIVAAWYTGQEGGNAIARMLLGEINPSGKLPFTWIRRWEDHSSYGFYPGHNGIVNYGEGLLLGYRFAEKFGKAPDFSFGHGLSYTNFAFGAPSVLLENADLEDLRVRVSLDVENLGSRAGKEVVQVYVEDVESSLPRPPKELKAFAKVFVPSGESRRVELELDARAFAFFDPAVRRWVIEPGLFRLHIGNSSTTITQIVPIQLGEIALNR